MPPEKSNNELLRDKGILSILNGDEGFGLLKINGTYGDINISMPYLSGPTLCDISNKFGFSATYGGSRGVISRKAYLDELLAYCIQNECEADLLSFLFSKEQFVDKLRGQNLEVIDYAYEQIAMWVKHFVRNF